MVAMLLTIFATCYLLLYLTITLSSKPKKEFSTVMKSNVTTLINRLTNIAGRDLLAALCEDLGFTVGVELGVQYGTFAANNLKRWPSCDKYYLVDLWAHQTNYHDRANYQNEIQNTILDKARHSLRPWPDKTVFIRNYTTNAVAFFPDNSIDFIYIDARHDYCGVYEDIEMWYPKLKLRGIMSGHDFMYASEVYDGQDWSLCSNGTRHPGAVKGAVYDFAKRIGITVYHTNEREGKSWIYPPKRAHYKPKKEWQLLKCASTNNVYLVRDKVKQKFLSEDSFLSKGYFFERVEEVSGRACDQLLSLPDGELI